MEAGRAAEGADPLHRRRHGHHGPEAQARGKRFQVLSESDFIAYLTLNTC